MDTPNRFFRNIKVKLKLGTMDPVSYAIWLAIDTGNFENLKKIDPSDIKSFVDKNKNNLLHWGVLAIIPCPEVVKFILDLGVDPNGKNGYGNTPLKLLCNILAGYGHPPQKIDNLCKILPFLLDRVGESASSQAPDLIGALTSWKKYDLVKSIFTGHFGFTECSRSFGLQGWNALHWAAKNNEVEFIEWLLDKGIIDINSTTKEEGLTALMIASAYGSEKAVTLLLERGAEVSISTQNGYKAIHFAPRRGKLSIVIDLVKFGADIESKTERESRPLHEACVYGQPEIVEYLLEHDVDAAAMDSDKRSAVWYAKNPLYGTKEDIKNRICNLLSRYLPQTPN